MSEWTIGVIGGSGLYAIDGLEGAQAIRIDSPFGEASDEVVIGTLNGHRFVFLPRHGKGHRISPTDVNARANIDVLKRAGCTDILAISAIGSLREELPPGSFVIVDQFIDRTVNRTKSFFGTGMVAHVSMAEPVCPRLSGLAAAAARAAGAPVSEGGTYLAMEGPQFSSRAESHMYRAWGCDVIGMTAMPEAKLAREAELPYALVGMVTDYDCWREGEAHVEVGAIIAQMNSNSAKARQLVIELARSLPQQRAASPIDTCLDFALITAPDARDPRVLAQLDAVAGRALRAR
ncbi:S-methyl-5'-thioadenosine phosphorylase [Blastomonas fulva]|jgi:5'-methylthioadenosine phosphorylase|uniref:S-methyl-5'-thioadenosine phosphorylase n=1 Tax=Blastomonas fulva TaxID=1550728 RepID=UPI003D2A215C